ncbi:MAG: class I SAM-dependent methyltransferase [Bacteroidota bacterium]|nr:class I SAM-dependent methyltransferase [Candidatus Kapabacteria bacterium]MDW8219293.1 class I SAM-dependent methyltransferase [Bacteroidota bacterium]
MIYHTLSLSCYLCYWLPYMLVPSSWFAEWFDHPLYLSLYSHRSDKEAVQVVELLLRSISLPRGARILDLCCGSGRHTKALYDAGFDVVGLDLSKNLLNLARQELAGLPVRLYQGDMRSPYPEGSYDCIANFFTSFGYFDNPSDDTTVIRRICEALNPSGYFFLDFFNAKYVRSHLVPADILVFDDFTITQKRSIEQGFVVKHITVQYHTCSNTYSVLGKTSDTNLPHSSSQTFVERVRLYEPEDLQHLLTAHGFTIHTIFGDYTGNPLSPDAPRCIVVAQLQH